mgnify:CR=1 FL=1
MRSDVQIYSGTPELHNLTRYKMNEFNLKKALAGERVTTEGGAEVTNLTVMKIDGSDKLVGVYQKKIKQWTFNGSEKPWNVNLHLKMAPDMGEGFLYVFDDGDIALEDKKCHAFSNPIMCFDLSKYPIGFGL